jgi:hypothetical protein
MIIVCVALIILLGKGTHKAYGHVKRKHQDRKRKRQDRVRDDQGCPSSSLPQSSQQVQGGRRGYRKLQINRRRRGDENLHHHEHDLEYSNTNLGISNEARASAASHPDRHTYHQRARDLGVAISLRQARRINSEESNEEEITEELPRYDRDAPRPPSYENCMCASPNSLFRGESNLRSACRTSPITESRVEEGV